MYHSRIRPSVRWSWQFNAEDRLQNDGPIDCHLIEEASPFRYHQIHHHLSGQLHHAPACLAKYIPTSAFSRCRLLDNQELDWYPTLRASGFHHRDATYLPSVPKSVCPSICNRRSRARAKGVRLIKAELARAAHSHCGSRRCWELAYNQTLFLFFFKPVTTMYIPYLTSSKRAVSVVSAARQRSSKSFLQDILDCLLETVCYGKWKKILTYT